jgi:sigma-B regulation protein RsbU (phosphoserine phosphatase)
MTRSTQVVLYDGAPRLAECLRAELTQRGLNVTSRLLGDVAATTRDAELAVLVLDPHRARDAAGLALDVIEQLVNARMPTLVWGLPEEAGRPVAPLVECVPSTAGLDEVLARLTTLARYGPLVTRLERELENLQRLGQQLNRYFGEIDQELRLAGRLQRDFLPAKLPQIPPLSFATVFRPASWVSGDMYDVFRIDEQHVGLFLTDAMGHGVAAGLLTMFLRQALVAKRLSGRSYQLVPPGEALANLNACLVRQRLPNCQFVTAVYALLNVETLELRLSRAGHPYPICMRADGTLVELPAPGSLLGIPDLPVEFGESRVRLEPGDRLLLYTDGIEDLFLRPDRPADDPDPFTARLHGWAGHSVHQLTRELGQHLDECEGSLHPADDVTLLAVEVAR